MSMKKERIARSFWVNRALANEFSAFCKTIGISVADGLELAITEFMAARKEMLMKALRRYQCMTKTERMIKQIKRRR